MTSRNARKTSAATPKSAAPKAPQTVSLDNNRFEAFVDFDTDGCVVQVGLRHFAIGNPAPAVRLNTGALELIFTAHSTDMDTLIDGFKEARRELRKHAKVVGRAA